MRTTCFMLLVALLFGGCFHSEAIDKSASGGQTKEVTSAHYIAGLAGTEVVQVAKLCPSGKVKHIDHFMSFGDCCLSGITFNIYTPRTTRLVCAGGSAYLLGQSEEGEVVQVIDITGSELATAELPEPEDM